MKLAILNGLPGTKKTEIAHNLERKISGSEVIHLDDYGGKNPPIPEEKKEEIYQTIRSFTTNLLIIEGINYDQTFLDNIIISAKNYHITYIELREEIDKILQIKSRAKRNTRENLIELENKLNLLYAPNKHIADQKNYHQRLECVSKIINSL